MKAYDAILERQIAWAQARGLPRVDSRVTPAGQLTCQQLATIYSGH